MDEGTVNILIIILSVGMGLILLGLVILLYYVVKIVRRINAITERAEHIAGNVEAVGEFFKQAAGPASIIKLVSTVVEAVRSKDNKKGK